MIMMYYFVFFVVDLFDFPFFPKIKISTKKWEKKITEVCCILGIVFVHPHGDDEH